MVAPADDPIINDGIVYLVLAAMKTHLVAKMQTEISNSGIIAERADVVKIGLFQDNPTNKNVHIYIQGGEHDTPGLEDGISSLGSFQNIAWRVPAREIGGGSSWWRNGVVNIGIYFIKEKLDEEAAHRRAYSIMSRLIGAVETCRVSGLVDSYGERALQLFAARNTMFESGGPPTNYIFRGKVYFQFLTERSK